MPEFHPKAKLFTVVKDILAKSMTIPTKALSNLVCAIYLFDGGKTKLMKDAMKDLLSNSKVVPKVALEILLELSQVIRYLHSIKISATNFSIKSGILIIVVNTGKIVLYFYFDVTFWSQSYSQWNKRKSFH